MTTNRKLAAVYFADLVGYSDLSSRDEPAALRLVDALQAHARREVSGHAGRIVKFVGDEVVAEFASGESAVRSACALQHSLSTAGGSLRIGVHLGDLTIAPDGDIYGDSVNIAARLQRIAQPGQVIISEDVWRQLRRNPAFNFEHLGSHELKGIAEPIEAYSVQVVAAAPRLAVLEAKPAPDRKRLIVLPFRALREDAETDFLRFGLADAITCSLSAVNSLTVRSVATGLKLAQGDHDPRAIGELADVDMVLLGTLLRIGDRMRVAAQLADARDGTVLWSQQENVTLDDLFQLQDALATRIVRSLALPLSGSEQQRMKTDVPASPAAYEYYLRANHLAYERNEWQPALGLYQAALEADPDYAPAWARLGRCYRLLGKYDLDPARTRENFASAEQAFRKALQLNPELTLAQKLYSQMEVDLGRATEAAARLLTLAHNHGGDAEIFAGLVHALRYCGLVDESLAAHKRARALEPSIRTSADFAFFMKGEYREAIRESVGDPFPALRAAAHLALGEKDAALAELAKPIPNGTGQVLVDALRAELDGEITRGFTPGFFHFIQNFPDPEGRFFLIRQLARAGMVEGALDHLEQVIAAGWTVPVVLEIDAWLASLRPNERFQRALERARQSRAAARDRFCQVGGCELLDFPVPQALSN